MFENNRDYPAAVTAPTSQDRAAIPLGMRWFAEQAAAVGGTPLLYAPGKRNIQANPLIAQLAATGILTATWRTLTNTRWSGGPVLAAWPDDEHLGRIADDHRTRALCVLPWIAKDVEAWQRAVAPDPLGEAEPTRPGRPLVQDPVVVEGLKTMTILVNLSNNLAGSLDKRDAVAVLRTLYEGGHRLVPEDIYAWALANGWQDTGARRLRELANSIADGKRPRTTGPAVLRPDSLQRWRDAATDGANES